MNNDQSILKDAASLWRSLATSAELSKICYDKELLSGNDSTPGLYEHLRISSPTADFIADLQRENISVEKLLVAFFKTLQPYTRMMTDICAFFERNSVNKTNEHIRIQFDFGSNELEKLDFDLNHFREELAQVNRVKNIASYLVLNNNAIWKLLDILSEDYSKRSEPLWIIDWRDSFRDGVWKPVKTPSSGFKILDDQLDRIFSLWTSFGEALTDLGIKPQNAYGLLNQKQTEGYPAEDVEIGWDLKTLADGTSDLWPAKFLYLLFYKLESIEKFPLEDSEREAEVFAEAIKMFLEKYGITRQKEFDLIKELQDLLKLPVWQKRYELYNVWIMTLMDGIINRYPGYSINQDNGILIFAFRPTKLATFDSILGKVELWSELRMPLEKPQGYTRTRNIQPDYIFVKKGEQPIAENGIVVVEVKQYQVPSTRNFTAALNDYSRGVENAHVFLVNYGMVRPSMILERPERCTALGHIRPGTVETNQFQDALSKELPAFPVPILDLNSLVQWSAADWMLLYLGYEYIYVDISLSLNTEKYKTFLKTVLKWSISGGSVGYLVAVDEKVRQIWTSPVTADVDTLIELPFEACTDFGGVIQGNRILIITDEDGLNIARYIGHVKDCHVIYFRENESIDYLVDLQ